MNKRAADPPEDLALRGLNYTKEQFEELFDQTERFVRQNPGQSLLYAFAAGYVLNRLPVLGIARGLVRLSIFALKPAVLLYGATKLYEVLQEK